MNYFEMVHIGYKISLVFTPVHSCSYADGRYACARETSLESTLRLSGNFIRGD